MKYIFLGNEVELLLTPQKNEFSHIIPDFDYTTKTFVITMGVNQLLIFNEKNNNKLNQQLLYSKIISILKSNASKTKLDYLQVITINRTKCWLIDNGVDICLMLPNEY